MHFFDVLYYYEFLFYKKVMRDPEPHFATVLGLSFSQSLLINGLMDVFALKCFCYQIAVWIQFGILVIIIFANYLIYHRTNRAKELMSVKPSFRNNRSLSIAITLLFFLVTSSWLFWGPIYGKYLLSHCR